MKRRVVLVFAFFLAACGFAGAQQVDDPGSPRTGAPLTILQLNDVYSTVPVDGVGGLARVASIKKQLTAAGRNTLLMIGGDFLSSSVASAVTKHLKVLERAKLISRGRNAQWRPCRIEVEPLIEASGWIEEQRKIWEARLDRLEDYLRKLRAKEKGRPS